MRRAVLLLAAAVIVPLLPAPASYAGTMATDVYRSRFFASDRAGRAYTIDALVEDRAAGGQLLLKVRRRCASCRADVYVRPLKPGDLLVRPVPTTECQCMFASVSAKFGGKELRIEWGWDLEQHSGPAGDGYEWATVTANNLMNVSCFGSGTYRTTPDPFSEEAPQPPRGAKEFPKKMPAPFKVDIVARPSCYVESP